MRITIQTRKRKSTEAATIKKMTIKMPDELKEAVWLQELVAAISAIALPAFPRRRPDRMSRSIR
jgi:hypothetical protein